MAGERILLVEDEARYRRLVQFNLETNGHNVSCAATGDEALKTFAQEMPDMVILDIMLPGMDGFEVCRRIREMSTVPIIMLTALGSDGDKVKGLRLGADDYITKPFSAHELLARVEAVFRRTQFSQLPPDQVLLSFGDLHMDLSKMEVTLGKREVELSPTEYRVLQFLAINGGRVLTQDDILENVWGVDYRGDHEVLRVAIWRLRNKLNDDPHHPQYITTMPGVGYLFRDPG